MCTSLKRMILNQFLTSRASTVFKYINMTVFKLSPPKNYLFMNWETLKFTFVSDNKKEIKKMANFRSFTVFEW